MDMSFAIQARSLEYLARHRDEVKPHLYPVPKEIDQAVAQAKLSAIGVQIDVLSQEQIEYLSEF
jgi:adenosylhomocysteinase